MQAVNMDGQMASLCDRHPQTARYLDHSFDVDVYKAILLGGSGERLCILRGELRRSDDEKIGMIFT